jgi:low affinity Fe/Cu permease
MELASHRSSFGRFARATASAAGRPSTFVAAVAIILIWAATGPLFGYSDTWQLVVNTATTVITFLMVFLIQNTQSRDSEAMHIKIHELIRALEGAHNALLDLEDLDERDLDKIRAQYTELARQARHGLREPSAP